MENSIGALSDVVRNKKGRRLKRYLGLRREHSTAFHGGIDRLLPARIVGWVIAADPNTSFYEVRLLVGPHLIARVEIDQPRSDVCEQLGLEGNPGFEMPLSLDLPHLDWTLPVRLLAVSADGSFQAELQLMQKDANTSERLLGLLLSEQRGMDGHADGIQNGELVGWAGRSGQQQPSQIWLQANGCQPVPIDCEQWREGLSNPYIPNQCGFAIAMDGLPAGWVGKSIWCSFDQAGQWQIPQDLTLVVPASAGTATKIVHQSAELTSVVTSPYSAQLEAAPEELQQHWKALEEFRVFLDGLELEVQRRESLLASQRNSPANLLLQRVGLLRRLLRDR